MARDKMTKTKLDSIYWYKQGNKKKFAYRYKYYDKFGKRREKAKHGFDTIQQAERELIEIKAAILDGFEEMVSNEHLKLAQWLDVWFELKKGRWEATTEALYKGLIKNHLKPRLGNTALLKLTRLLVQSKLVDAMNNEGYAQNTIKRAATLLVTVLNDALNEGMINKPPFTKLDFSRVSTPKKRTTLQLDELKYFMECIEKENITRKTILYMLILLGVRGGEALALRYRDINLEDRTIRIDETRSYYKNKSGRPKSKNSYRTLKIPQNLYDILVEYNHWFKATMNRYDFKIEPDSYYFITFKGQRVSPDYINSTFRDLRKKYKLSNLTGHMLRHTYASILISNNVAPSTVAKLLGDTVETVVKVYVHPIDAHDKKALDVIEEINSTSFE